MPVDTNFAWNARRSVRPLPGMDVSLDLTDRLSRRDFQVAGRLQVEPELRRCPEVARQTERRVGGDASPPPRFAHPGHWYAQVSRQGVHAEPERLHQVSRRISPGGTKGNGGSLLDMAPPDRRRPAPAVYA